MPNSLWAVVRDGRIELLEPAELPDGAKLRVIVVTDAAETQQKDQQFWLGVSQSSLDAIWGNAEDDVYAELLRR
jgi:hypothetical protein